MDTIQCANTSSSEEPTSNCEYERNAFEAKIGQRQRKKERGTDINFVIYE